MPQIFVSPGKYVQGAGVTNDIGRYIAPLGQRALILGGQRGLDSVSGNITQSLDMYDVLYHIERFQGESSDNEIRRMCDVGRAKNIDVAIGVGGGKAIDTAKAVGFELTIPVAIIPTIASTDAPCSALSVIYNDAGVFEKYLLLPKNPDIVLIDTEVIAHSPVRQLVAGMGDALSTYFEAAACARARAQNIAGGTMTQAALAIARLCYDTLLSDGYKAKIACERNVVTEALTNIVEANTLLSGLGFESAGLAACHAIHNGLTVLDETHPYSHGEKVAFGTLTQLVLENRSLHEIEEVLGFCHLVGLPTTFADIGLNDAHPEQIRQAAEAACNEGETIYNMDIEITPKKVYAAMVTADALGHAYKQKEEKTLSTPSPLPL
ncbi:glycerol dehydrogenase [Aneurinibacillus sp. REN35]|uniref:glycerol dehydrogenase n=1 Tax=Aneurinibacillus sp. REN35 TaxID=3237286 RepID=UPI003528C1D2